MTDDFESELRESLGKAVPTPPEAPDRASGARAYTHRVRRSRAIITVGAAAAVVAAIVVVPSVLASGDGDNNTGPAVKTPQTLLTLTMPPVAHPFACPGRGLIHDETPPVQGVVPSGAVLARLCAVNFRISSWSAPAEPLVTDLDGLVRALNAIPKVPEGAVFHCPPETAYQTQYTLTFQYPDGHLTSVEGRTGGCDFITAGRAGRQGAVTLLRDYLARLHDQRAIYSPLRDQTTPLSCPDDPQGLSPVLVDGVEPDLIAAKVCAYVYPGPANPTAEGSLSRQQIQQVENDIAANASHRRPPPPADCRYLRGPSGALVIEGVNRWDDRVELAAVGCGGVYTFLDRSGTWYWAPSRATSAIIDSVLHNVPHPDGQVDGRLLAVSGSPRVPPQGLSGSVTFSSAAGALQLTVESGRFHARLQPGRYRVTGHSASYNDGKGWCTPPRPFVTVIAHQTVRVAVYCRE